MAGSSDVRRNQARRAMLAVAVVCLPFVLPAGARAQVVEWWRDLATQRQLRLTPGQVFDIDAVFRASLPERKRLRLDLLRLESRLRAVMDGDAPDEATVLALIEEVEQTRARGNVLRSLMLLRMHRILTTRQRSMLRTLSPQLLQLRCGAGGKPC